MNFSLKPINFTVYSQVIGVLWGVHPGKFDFPRRIELLGWDARPGGT
tara:strand:+ start:3213 stop:3353 length:141 start_codon:yes stop_codon:yes gene_type:complete